MSGEIRCFINLGPLQDLGFDRVWGQLDVESPLLDLGALRDHFIQLADGVDTVVWLLEETLTHLSDRLLVLAHLLGDADEHAQFWRQIDVLAFLFDFK